MFEIVKTPKKRGRKPGSKNKVKRMSSSNLQEVVYAKLQREVIALADSITKAQDAYEKEIEKIKARHQKELERQKDKMELSIKLWKNRSKEYRAKLTSAGSKRKKVGRPASTPIKALVAPKKVVKLSSVLRKGGGRRKPGEMTKRDLIINFMIDYKKPISSKGLIEGLFDKTEEKDLKKFSQGIYTTLTQIYKRGELVNNDGLIRLPQ